MRHEARLAARRLLASPGFTAIVVITLAIGIGANTAIFSAVNATLLRPLPYSEPGRLVLLSSVQANRPDDSLPFSWPRFEQIRDRNRTFAAVAAFTSEFFNLTGRGDPEQVPAARVSSNFFDLLGARPILGRGFTADEGRPGGRPVVLLSYDVWMRKFDGDRSIIGQAATLDGTSYTIIGVLPRDFTFQILGSDVDLWTPRVFELNLATPQQIRAGVGYLNAVARLRPGVTVDAARADMAALNRQYQIDRAGAADVSPDVSMDVGDLQQRLVSNIRTAMLMLLAAVGVILLIACANVASLVLSRWLARRRDLAVRAALGASRGALVGQLLAESLLLAALGGAAGFLLGWIGTRVLVALAQDHFPQLAGAALDARGLVFTAAVALLSGLVVGVLPAWQVSRGGLDRLLREDARGSVGSRRQQRLRTSLVVAQVALSMLLLVTAGLLVRSFVRLQTVSPGFDPGGVLTMEITLPGTKYATPESMVRFSDDALRRTRVLPGVQAAAISSAMPLALTRMSPVLMEGQPAVPIGERPIVDIQAISRDYTRVMRIPLVSGRLFTEHDSREAPHVAIVNAALARRFWPGVDPIGKHVWLGRQTSATEVVGVIGDVKDVGLDTAPSPAIYLPFSQLPWTLLHLSVRTAVAPMSVAGAVRAQIAAIDPDQPVTHVETLDALVARAGARPKLNTVLFAMFAAIALVLAAVGIYGTMTTAVVQRTPEIGVRGALGASTADILRLVLGSGLRLVVVGLALGLAAAVALTRVMASLLYETSALDPLTFLASVLLFVLIALVACYVPARRAIRVDPVIALRTE